MADIIHVSEIRPPISEKIGIGSFSPRTPAIEEAFNWGKELHAGHVRMNGDPYFETHCVWAADYIDKLVHNEAWTIAALLHDSVEDRGGSLDQIKAHFPGGLGEYVAYIVDGVSKLSVHKSKRSRDIEALRKLAIYRDPGVFLVKLADKTHNVMTLEHMPEARRREKAEEAIKAYGRLAGILNCYEWRRWLEDMAFPHFDPMTFNYVQKRIDADPRLNVNFINDQLEKLGQIMDHEGIRGRAEVVVNGYWLTWQKLRRMARERYSSLDDFSNVNDLVSFRLVVPSEKNCYTLLGGVNRYLGPYMDQNRFDDYIACPQNGYRALQITARLPNYGAIEVAIATEDMEGENRWGIIYAINKGCSQDEYRPVVILTPTGSTRFVPEGSTVIDAVATIQQEFLLDKISSLIVNGRLAKLSDRVNPGDLIEVVTNGPRLVPSPEWLGFCNVSTSRLVRMLITKETIRKQAELGRKEVRTVLTHRGTLFLEDVQTLEKDRLDNLLEHMSCINLEDLYSAIGGGAIRLDDLATALDDVGVTREQLNWTTVYVEGASPSNRPGVLATLAHLVSEQGGNIIRSINNTTTDGSFTLRLVIKDLSPEQAVRLRQSYENCGIGLKILEIS